VTGVYLVLSTVSSEEEGSGMARRLVEERHAACVNVVPRVRSVYVWDGAVQESDEALLVIKTGRDRYPALAERIRQLHSYSVPEIVAVPIESGSPAYVDWVLDAVATRGGEVAR
jgi:periplasmic divalent cation tolerance protein